MGLLAVGTAAKRFRRVLHFAKLGEFAKHERRASDEPHQSQRRRVRPCAPLLLAYPTYTVIAEKLHAIALLGITNSRLKHYFDLSVLLERGTLDTDLLAQAIKATFEPRCMSVPDAPPVELTDEFAHDSSRRSPWLAFLKKNELPPKPLPVIVDRLRFALAPAIKRAGL